MQGEIIAEEKGKVTTRRVLHAESGKFETSYTANAKFKGIEGVNMGTYDSWMLPDGSMEGKGQGVFMSKDGQMVSWTGIGLGGFTGPDKIKYRGSIHYKTQSKGSLSPFNNMVEIFEHDGDIEGNISSKVWEWK